MKGDLCVKKFLSIFMSVVMAVTMSPKVSFAEGGTTENKGNEEQQAGETTSEKDNANTDSEGAFKYLQDKFSLFTGFAKEKAPKVWELLKPYVDKGTNWGKDYYNNASEFVSKVGPLGVAATMGLATLAVKAVWKVFKFIVALFDDESKQSGGYASNSSYSANSGQTTAYTYSTGGYQTPYSYMS